MAKKGTAINVENTGNQAMPRSTLNAHKQQVGHLKIWMDYSWIAGWNSCSMVQHPLCYFH